MDQGALYFDSEAEKEGVCQYTRIIFYAGRNVIDGVGTPIDSIQVFRRILNEDEPIGTVIIRNEENPAPDVCTPTNDSVVYPFTSPTTAALFTTRYYSSNGVQDNGTTYEFSTSPDQECRVQNLTL